MSKYPLDIPYPCDTCGHANREVCNYAECARWHRWFKRQWTQLKKDYASAKKRKAGRKEKAK